MKIHEMCEEIDEEIPKAILECEFDLTQKEINAIGAWLGDIIFGNEEEL